MVSSEYTYKLYLSVTCSLGTHWYLLVINIIYIYVLSEVLLLRSLSNQ